MGMVTVVHPGEKGSQWLDFGWKVCMVWWSCILLHCFLMLCSCCFLILVWGSLIQFLVSTVRIHFQIYVSLSWLYSGVHGFYLLRHLSFVQNHTQCLLSQVSVFSIFCFLLSFIIEIPTSSIESYIFHLFSAFSLFEFPFHRVQWFFYFGK